MTHTHSTSSPQRGLFGPLTTTARLAILVFSGLQLSFIAWCLWQTSTPILSATVALSSICLGGVLTYAWLNDALQRQAQTQMHSSFVPQNLVSSVADLTWETNLEGVLVSLDGRLIPHGSNETHNRIGQHLLDVIKFEDAERHKIQTALETGTPSSDIQSLYQNAEGQLYYLSLSAAPKRNAAGVAVGFIGMATNITERVLNERRLKQLAENDTLTSLANRHHFNEKIQRDMRDSTAGTCLALFAIDLDGFKQINDTHGHQAGDALLNLVAKRLRSHIRDGDWAARLGGDEFMVVSRGIKGPMDSCLMAARLISVLAQPYRVGSIEVTVTASIGIACAPIHAQDPEALMKNADTALYQAKSDGRNRFSLFAEEAQKSADTVPADTVTEIATEA